MTVISVENVSKSYRLGLIGGGTLKEDFARWCAKLQGKPDPLLKIGEEHHARHMGEQFWALDKVSFDVKEGEIVGIIGRNGAGKSTLLKILSQVTTPTSGQIKIKGRIASLLEVGTGFHPELTGRENVFLNGAILGMTKAEIRRKFDEIVAFSGIEEFIDTPVKRYSSGMYVRLAFAVAAHLEPEILIVDEVLAVGDAEFQNKCLGKMEEVSSSGRTVLFVSHTMSAVKRLCARVIWINGGGVKDDGPTDAVCDRYLSDSIDTLEPSYVIPDSYSHQPESLRFISVQILDKEGVLTNIFRADESITVRIHYQVQEKLSETIVDINVYDVSGSYLWSMNDSDAFPELYEARHVGTWSYECVIPQSVLAPGKYLLGCSGGTPRKYCDMPLRIPFEISATGYWKPSYLYFGVGGGPIAVKMIASKPQLIAVKP